MKNLFHSMIARMNRLSSIIIIVTITVQAIHTSAQNLLHYAISTNGERGECLFPEDEKGNVVFSSVIEVPHTSDSIMLAINDYISAQSASDNCVIECLAKSARTSTYSVQLNIGKQSWGMEYWGTPLFVTVRDASHVKFKCIIEARNGKYKYSLIDFETNRNTIRGEAKNDGQPNVIHWQRVNSLTKERDAYTSSHDTSKRKAKEVLYDFNAQIAYETCLYQAEYDVTKRFEDGLKNLDFGDNFMDISNTTTSSEQSLNSQALGRNSSFSIIGNGFFTQAGNYSGETNKTDSIGNNSNFYNYEGFLLDKGCNVFITGNDTSFEQAGVQELIKQTIIDGFWNVVNDMHQAHFIIKYYVDLEGRDTAHLIIMTPDGSTSKKIASQGTSESTSENHETARSLYLNNVMPLFKKIETKKIPNTLSVFTK